MNNRFARMICALLVLTIICFTAVVSVSESKLESRVEEVQQRRAEEEAKQAAQEEQANSYPVAVGRSLDARKTMAIKYKGKLEWSSSDEAVATVSPRGDVKGISAGKAVITAKSVDDEEVNESITVSVVVPIKKISVSEKNLEIPVDMTWNLTAVITPEDATNQKLEWSSSNEKIASVDQNGLVTGKSIGKTKITAAATDGSKAKAVINLKVDKFDVVIDGMGSAKQTLYTNHFGGEYIKAKTKNKVVDVKMYGTSQSYTSGGIQYGTTFEITAKKPGIDIITYSYGGSKTKSRVFVSLKYQTDQEALKKMFEEAEAEGQTGIIHAYRDEDGNLIKIGETTEATETKETESIADINDENGEKNNVILFKDIPWGTSYNEIVELLNEKGITIKEPIIRNAALWAQIESDLYVGDYKAYENGMSFACNSITKENIEINKNKCKFYKVDLYFDLETPFEELKQAVMEAYGLLANTTTGSTEKCFWEVYGVAVRLSVEKKYIQLTLEADLEDIRKLYRSEYEPEEADVKTYDVDWKAIVSNYEFRGSAWGSTKENVSKTEPGSQLWKKKEGKTETVGYKAEDVGNLSEIQYYFVIDKLCGAGYYHNMVADRVYEKIRDDLKTEYGQMTHGNYDQRIQDYLKVCSPKFDVKHLIDAANNKLFWVSDDVEIYLAREGQKVYVFYFPPYDQFISAVK